MRLLGLSVAVANPYVLDFFSLARGYALALALVAASAMFALRCVELPTVRMAFAAVTCAAVAVIANFATLDYYLGVLVVIGLVLVQGRRACEVRVDLHRLAAAIIAPTLAVAYLGGVPLIRLRSEGELYYGGETGFWHDTVRSLISSSLYHRGGDLFHLALAVSVGMSVAIGGVAAVLAMRRRHLPPHAAAFVLLAVPGFATVAQHALLGSRFLIDRTALFFVPLFAIWLALAADALARDPRYRAGVTAGAAVIAIAAWVNLASAANLSSTLDWRYDASTKQVVGDLSARLGTGRPIDLGASWLFEPTINFYRATRYPSFVPVPTCRSACLAARSDYYYVVGPDVATVRARGAQVIRIYQPAGGVLARDADAHT